MTAVPEMADPRLALDDATQQLRVIVNCTSPAEARKYRNRCNRLRALDLGKAEERARGGHGPIPPEVEALRTLLVRVKGSTVEIVNCSHEDASEIFPKFKVERN
jgi:hypothetical protein